MVLADQQRHATVLGTVEYLDIGAGIPTLYFHGTGAGADAALLLEQSLLKCHCRLIIPNRPGYYGTTLGRPGSAKFCTDLAAKVLDHLAINRVAVIGTSGGGMPAACFARCYPDRTAALVLQCDTIRCSTLIIHDRADPLVPFAHAAWSQSCIPQSHLLEIHAGGHMIWFGRESTNMHRQRVEFMRESFRTPHVAT